MCDKKIFLVCVLLFLHRGTLFSEDFNIEDINGVWMMPRSLKKYLSNHHDRRYVLRDLGEDFYIISWDSVEKKGIIGFEYDTIQSVEVVGKRVTISFGRELVLEYVSRDVFHIISSTYYSNPDYLYRVCDFAKKPQAKGRINNSGVRFRNTPELTSGVWFHLDFGEELEIIGISKEKQTIGGLEAYWYEVRLHYPLLEGMNGGLDGWVFGAYLDVENRAELEEKLKKLRRDDG